MLDWVEQARAEQRSRWRRGERVPAEEYLARHAGPADEERVLELIYQEVLLREEHGEAPEEAEYQRRFPQLADRVRQLFEVHSVFASAESVGPGQAGGEAVPSTVLGPDRAWPPHRRPVPPPVPLPAIPGYEVIEELGAGGMAVVYKARHAGLDRLVAVKVVPLDSADPAFAERFAREARVLARLGHPHIVAVHDFGQAGGLCYLVMEYVEGVNLRQALRAGTLRPEEALGLVEQLCDALRHAHDQGVIHRDIKPENLLLDRQGRVKVADFGLAKLLGPRPSAALTGARQIMGTWHYMAPEQVRAARDVDHRADLYALGVTLYELLTGALPEGRFAQPSRRAGVDARLDAVVRRALEKEPARRYQSAAEIKADIAAIRRPAGEGSDPARPARGSQRRTSSYLRWVALPAVGLFVLLLVGSCAGLPRGPEGAVPAVLLSSNGFLVWALGFFVASLVWVFRQRDTGTVVPVCGVFSLVVGVWGIASACQVFLAKPAGAPEGALFTVWGVAAAVFHAFSSVGWLAGGVGLLQWRGWARRLVLATSWAGLAYYAAEVPAYAAFVMTRDVEEFSRACGPDEWARFLAGAAFVLVLALVAVVRAASTLGLGLMLRRAEVVRAFAADGEGQETRLVDCAGPGGQLR